MSKAHEKYCPFSIASGRSINCRTAACNAWSKKKEHCKLIPEDEYE